MELPSIEILLIYIIITAYACWSTVGLGVKFGYIKYTNEPKNPEYRYKDKGHGYEYPQTSSSKSAKSSATMAAPPSGRQSPAMVFNTVNLFSPLPYNKTTEEKEKVNAEEVSLSKKNKKQTEAAAWAREYPSIAEVSDIKLARMTEKYNKVRKENEELRESRDYDVKENNRLNALVKSSAQDKVAMWGQNRALREELKELQRRFYNNRTVDEFWQGLDDVKGGLKVRIGELEAEVVRVREEGEREAQRRVQEIMDEADRRLILAYNERHQASLKIHDTFVERVAEKEEMTRLRQGFEKRERDLREQHRRAKWFDDAVNRKHQKHLEIVEKWAKYKQEWERKNRFFVRKLWDQTTAGQRQYWQDLCAEEGMDIGSVICKLIQGCMVKDEVIGRVVDERDEERRRHEETRRGLGRSEDVSEEGGEEGREEVSEAIGEEGGEEGREEVSLDVDEEMGEKVRGEFNEEVYGWPEDTDVEGVDECESEGGREEGDGRGNDEEVERGRKKYREEVELLIDFEAD